jgi:Fe-S-cluster containining protein
MGEAKRKKAYIENILLKPDGKFQFLCHGGLPCFTQCCEDVNLFLTPYDVLRMKNRVRMASGEFLERYTVTIKKEDWPLPAIVLKMNDDEDKTCPFVTPEGCTIYEDRPWACRSYPLQPVVSKKFDKQAKEYYTIARKRFCLGFDEEKEWTVQEWKKDQGIDVYLEMEEPLKEITLSEGLQNEKIVNEDIKQMFRMALFDLDRFRSFVFETKFLSIFDIEKEVVEKIKTDDVELLKLGFRWIKFGLIERDSLKVRKDILEAKKKALEKEKTPSKLS